MTSEDPDPLHLPDLASRALRGSVIAASDEFFAEKENLINPAAAVFSPHTFGHKGQLYDGWETRRRRGGPADLGLLPDPDEHDWVIVRLGAPGVPSRRITQSCSAGSGSAPPGPRRRLVSQPS